MVESLKQAIFESVHDVFTSFLARKETGDHYTALSLQESKLYILPAVEVTAIIGYQGAIRGSLHLAAPMPVALAMASALCGEPLQTFSAVSRDGYGEIANMIAGGVSTRLSATNRDIYLVPPTLVYGNNFKTTCCHSFNRIKKHFQTAQGPFFVECFFAVTPC